MGKTQSSRGPQLRLVLDFASEAEALTAVRLMLVADVLTRITESVQEGRVFVTTLGPDARTCSDAIAMARALNVSPCVLRALPVGATSLGEIAAGLTSLFLTTTSGRYSALPGPRLIVGGVHYTSGRVREEWLQHGGRDPLALRLALLRFSPEASARLSQARLNRAEETLDRWRFKVAGSHDTSPDPAPPHIVAAMHDHLVMDLDTRMVLTMLHRVEVDLAVSSGAKYQIFSHLDTVLGLDLGRLVDKLRR